MKLKNMYEFIIVMCVYNCVYVEMYIASYITIITKINTLGKYKSLTLHLVNLYSVSLHGHKET